MTNFIDAIGTCDISSISQMEAIKDALDERYDTLQMQEPDFNNEFFYEKWEEKFDEFEELKDNFDDWYDELEELMENKDELDEEDELYDIDIADYEMELERLQREYDSWVLDVEAYQDEYGGLKRLKVFF